MDEARVFTALELTKAVGMQRDTAKRFLRYLQDEKRVQVAQRARGRIATTYRVINTEPLSFGRRPSFKHANPARQRVWNSCRILRTFTLHELAATSQTAYGTCCSYVKRLEQVGLVRKVRRHAPEQGEYALFRLNVDVGHAHPIVRDDGVYCPGRNTLYPYKEAQHD
jgi:predicted transcriptional regulator